MSWRNKLYQIIFTANTKAGKQFNLVLFISILASVLVILLDSVKSIKSQFTIELRIAELFFTFLFSVEYIMRLLVVKNRYKYAFSFFGIVDLISILPTYVSLLWSGTPSFLLLRTLRLFRIFRIIKLIEFWSEAKILGEAIKRSSRKITAFLTVVLILSLIIGSLMYVIEGPTTGFTSIPQSMYWTIVTITTVGYGDIAPQTSVGKFLAAVLMLIGYGIIAVPTGLVTVDLYNVYNTNSAKNSQKYCPNCSCDRHDLDAKYCKYCGTILVLNEIQNKSKQREV